MKKEKSKEFEDHDYYHGLLPREDIPHLLRKPGDFLVRQSETTAGQARQTIISLMIDAETTKHIIVARNLVNGKWATDNTRFFDSIHELITHYIQTREPIPTAILVTPINRAPWELKHEDVELFEKLGEGAFGEVRAGRLNLQSKRKVMVAVKLAKTSEMSKEKIKEIMKEARMMRSQFMCSSQVRRLFRLRASECRQVVRSVCGKRAASHRNGTGQNQRLWIISRRRSLHDDNRSSSSRQMVGSRYVHVSTIFDSCVSEVIQSLVYTAKSDVWAYGVMIWEIYSNAVEP
ncbi:Tyrosine-protein kinase [Aphelenchoides besseyi]|nr:Tyrosine-protein kinase [Aphelenchoides besseyi]